MKVKFGEQNSEILTLQMFGTQSAANDGTPIYSLTGTCALSGIVLMTVMISTTIYENHCNVFKRVESVRKKPLYDPVDAPDATPNGAFLRWSSE